MTSRPLWPGHPSPDSPHHSSPREWVALAPQLLPLANSSWGSLLRNLSSPGVLHCHPPVGSIRAGAALPQASSQARAADRTWGEHVHLYSPSCLLQTPGHPATRGWVRAPDREFPKEGSESGPFCTSRALSRPGAGLASVDELKERLMLTFLLGGNPPPTRKLLSSSQGPPAPLSPS